MRPLGAIACLLLCSCAARAPQKPAKPAPVLSSVEPMRVAVRRSTGATESAQQHVAQAIRLVTDPRQEAELEAARNDLVTITNENSALRTLIDADEAQKETFRVWGIGQQQEAAANADGWRAAQAKCDKARNTRWEWAGIAVVLTTGLHVLIRWKIA